MKLRSYLIIVVAAALVPLLIFAGALLVMFHNQRRAALEQMLIERTHALSLDVDRELSASIRALQALATSIHLDAGGLKQFYEQARRVLEAASGWENIALVDPSGQQILSLRRPLGTKLPPVAVPETIRQVIETRKPTVSDLFTGTIVGTPLILIAVPVIRRGDIQYLLASSTPPRFLTALLAQQEIPPDWIATIIDGKKTIIARSQKFLGQSAGPIFAAKGREAVGGLFYGVLPEGTPVTGGGRRTRRDAQGCPIVDRRSQ